MQRWDWINFVKQSGHGLLCTPAAALKVMARGSLWADDRPNSASSVECTTFYVGVDLELKESLITGDGLLLFRYCLETTNVVRNS